MKKYIALCFLNFCSLFCNSFIMNADISGSSNRRNILKGIGTTLVGFAAIPQNSEASESEYILKRKGTSIIFYGDINVMSCMDLTNALKEAILESKSVALMYGVELPIIELHIQSHGGSLLPTIAVVDFIQNSDVQIDSYIDGFAASSASLIAVSCNKRYMTKNSLTLLHQLSGSVSGKYNDMLEEVGNLDSFMSIIKNIYLDNTKIKKNEINEILSHDIWFSAEKCLELGIIDGIVR